MFWEHSPYSTNIASDWLRAELSCGWGRKRIKKKWMTVSLDISLASEHSFYLLTCGRRSLVSGTQNDIVVRWIALIMCFILKIVFKENSYSFTCTVWPRKKYIQNPTVIWSLSLPLFSSLFLVAKLCWENQKIFPLFKLPQAICVKCSSHNHAWQTLTVDNNTWVTVSWRKVWGGGMHHDWQGQRMDQTHNACQPTMTCQSEKSTSHNKQWECQMQFQ